MREYQWIIAKDRQGTSEGLTREIKSHQEETEVVNLGTSEEKKEVKIGTCASANIRDELVALLRAYQDIFAWSYQDMPGLSSEIVQHKLPLNPKCSPVKQKLRRMKPEMSLKIKEEVKKHMTGDASNCFFTFSFILGTFQASFCSTFVSPWSTRDSMVACVAQFLSSN